MLIIFAGNIGRSGLGGKAWANMQYLAGLTMLGHTVIYLEDCGDESWVYNWDTEQLTTDLKYPSSYVCKCLAPLGLKNQWIYRAGQHSEGIPIQDFLTLCSQTDLLIIWADPIAVWRAEYDQPKRRIFIDVDPGFIQMSLANGDAMLETTVARCDRLFTIGQNIGSEGCSIPNSGYQWLKTVPPVSLAHWSVARYNTAENFTSIMSWRGFRDVLYEGVFYGQKDKEFPKFFDLPSLTTQSLLIALLNEENKSPLEKHGWKTIPGWVPSATPESYHEFIQTSRAEFSVAKNGYVITRGGWFSDRSVCYLASGRPVLVQDTGLEDWLPIGEGVLTFSNLSEALSGIESINANYKHHRYSGRMLAEQFFAAERVLPTLLEASMS